MRPWELGHSNPARDRCGEELLPSAFPRGKHREMNPTRVARVGGWGSVHENGSYLRGLDFSRRDKKSVLAERGRGGEGIETGFPEV